MFRLGFAFEPFETDIHKLTTSVQLNHPNDNSENISLGAEYTFFELNSKTNVFLRGGYKINADEQDYSFGAGLKVPLSIATFTFDYAYTHFQKLGTSHRLSLVFGI